MNIRDKITVITSWLDDVPSRANEARKFMDDLADENAKLSNELDSKNTSISDIKDGFSIEDMETIWKEGLAFGNMYALGKEIETFQECMKRIKLI